MCDNNANHVVKFTPDYSNVDAFSHLIHSGYHEHEWRVNPDSDAVILCLMGQVDVAIKGGGVHRLTLADHVFIHKGMQYMIENTSEDDSAYASFVSK